MAWTDSVILGLISIPLILLLINRSLDKSRQGLKVFLIILPAAFLILIAGAVKQIIDDNAAGSIADYTLLANSALIVTVVSLAFIVAYFMIMYIRGALKAVKDAKKDREELDWQT